MSLLAIECYSREQPAGSSGSLNLTPPLLHASLDAFPTKRHFSKKTNLGYPYDSPVGTLGVSQCSLL